MVPLWSVWHCLEDRGVRRAPDERVDEEPHALRLGDGADPAVAWVVEMRADGEQARDAAARGELAHGRRERRVELRRDQGEVEATPPHEQRCCSRTRAYRVVSESDRT